MSFIRRELPILVSSIIAIILVLREFVVYAPLNTLGGTLVKYATIIGAFAAGLAAAALLGIHIKHIVKKTPNQWYYSITLIASLILFVVTGIMKVPWYSTLYTTFVGRPFGVNWGIMLFFMISATYRSFRIRTLESLAIMLGWAVVLLTWAPIGSYIFGTSGALLSSFLLHNVATGALRGFVITTALGSIIFSIRVILGREKGAFGAEAPMG